MADESLVIRPAGAYHNADITNSIITELTTGTDTLATAHKNSSNKLPLPSNQINASTAMLYNHVLPYYHPSNYSSLSCYPVSDLYFILFSVAGNSQPASLRTFSTPKKRRSEMMDFYIY